MTSARSGTLVFPSSVAAAVAYAREAAQRGERVVGASSLPGDENAHAFDAWERLPSIHEPGFAEAIADLVARHGLTHVHAPLTTVHGAIQTLIDEGRLAVRLVRPNPIAEQNQRIRHTLQRAATLQTFIGEIVGADRLPPARIAAILGYAGACYGECSDTKLAALLAVAADAPKGDVIEIGTLMGRSASVLVLAAQAFAIGPVLTVDPWVPAHAKQHDSPALIQDLVDLWDFELLRQGYFLNIAPIAGEGRVNHLRLPSEEGVAVYAADRRAETAELGVTTYSGRIALLHIDGNHDLDAVRNDWEAWGRHMVPGGWVVLDDYCWHHGTGPRIVGDGILEDPGAWDRAFVCGGALFIRLAGGAEG